MVLIGLKIQIPRQVIHTKKETYTFSERSAAEDIQSQERHLLFCYKERSGFV